MYLHHLWGIGKSIVSSTVRKYGKFEEKLDKFKNRLMSNKKNSQIGMPKNWKAYTNICKSIQRCLLKLSIC